jgi:hypothetical protein
VPYVRGRIHHRHSASVIVRTCGITDDDYDEVISWATRLRGEEYLLSVFCDMAVEPQWRPEWADSRFLTADVFGRAYGAFLALPEAIAPESWRTRLTTAKVWIDADDLNSLMSFPAVLEGARRARIPAISELGETIAEAYGQLSHEPSIEMLLRLTPALQAYGVPDGVNISARQVVALIRNGTDGLDGPIVQAALTLTAHIATLAKDTELADAVAEICIEMVLSTGNRDRSMRLSSASLNVPRPILIGRPLGAFLASALNCLPSDFPFPREWRATSRYSRSCAR